MLWHFLSNATQSMALGWHGMTWPSNPATHLFARCSASLTHAAHCLPLVVPSIIYSHSPSSPTSTFPNGNTEHEHVTWTKLSNMRQKYSPFLLPSSCLFCLTVFLIAPAKKISLIKALIRKLHVTWLTRSFHYLQGFCVCAYLVLLSLCRPNV